MYDQDKRPTIEDGGDCPACGKSLLLYVAKTEPSPHPMGGLSWDCQHCGTALRENDHGALFIDDAVEVC